MTSSRVTTLSRYFSRGIDRFYEFICVALDHLWTDICYTCSISNFRSHHLTACAPFIIGIFSCSHRRAAEYVPQRNATHWHQQAWIDARVSSLCTWDLPQPVRQVTPTGGHQLTVLPPSESDITTGRSSGFIINCRLANEIVSEIRCSTDTRWPPDNSLLTEWTTVPRGFKELCWRIVCR